LKLEEIAMSLRSHGNGETRLHRALKALRLIMAKNIDYGKNQ
jgi:hypothetical protein